LFDSPSGGTLAPPGLNFLVQKSYQTQGFCRALEGATDLLFIEFRNAELFCEFNKSSRCLEYPNNLFVRYASELEWTDENYV
jgi:hypothetical protein